MGLKFSKEELENCAETNYFYDTLKTLRMNLISSNDDGFVFAFSIDGIISTYWLTFENVVDFYLN